MKCPPDIEEEFNSLLPARMRDVRDPRCGDGPQAGGLAQASVRLLEVWLEQGRELAESLAAHVDEPSKVRHALRRHRAPVGEDAVLQLACHRLVTGDHPGIEQAEKDLHVLARESSRLAEGTDAVIEPQAGIPDGVPDPLGRSCGSPRIGAVQHDEVEITPGSELHPAMTADCEQAHVGAAALSRAEQAPEPVVGEHRQRRASPRSDRAGATNEFAARIEE
jgi:hypothetical protein